MRSLPACIFLFLSSVVAKHVTGIPSKIYGVNLGSWLVLESWMLPQEWVDMGGQICSHCLSCIASESNSDDLYRRAFAKAYPDTVDAKFKTHWETWFNVDDVNALSAAGINMVRVPLGYWIIEDLVIPNVEHYPKGGLSQLRRGLQQLSDAGIAVVLDHHALPGAQTPGQMFTGSCTSDVEFYTPFNYGRTLTWTAVMTALSHLDPSFASVVSIEAVNEPIMDATQTPGYGDFQKNFVRVVRAVELLLSIPVPNTKLDIAITTSNFTAALGMAAGSSIFNSEVKKALADASPILLKLGVQFALKTIFDFKLSNAPFHSRFEPLTTAFMDRSWQHNNPPNPADAANGPSLYDNHLYYVFGGVADANPTAYMTSICNLNRVQADAAFDNTPLVFAEWGLPTQFNATDAFLRDWADAQKIAYSKGKGWMFWNFKVEVSALAGDLAREWSYLEGVKRGYLTKDPANVNNPHVCDPFIQKTAQA